MHDTFSLGSDCRSGYRKEGKRRKRGEEIESRTMDNRIRQLRRRLAKRTASEVSIFDGDGSDEWLGNGE